MVDTLRKVRPAGWVVAGSAAAVAAAEIVLLRTGNDPITAVAHDTMSHRWWRWALLGGWAVISAHVLVPDAPPLVQQADPFRYLSQLVTIGCRHQT